MGSVQFELFNKQQDSARRFIVLNIQDFDQSSLCRAIVTQNVGFVVDLRLRSVFDQPKFNHLYMLNYFTHRSIRFIQFPILEKQINRGEFSLMHHIQSRRSFSMSEKSILAITDDDDRSRANAKKIREFFSRLRVQIVESHPSTVSRN
jgi:hypothetical protein